MKLLKIKLHWQILIVLALALLTSFSVKMTGGPNTTAASIILTLCKIFGDLFLNSLKMLVVPLVASSVVSGMIGMGAEKNFGRMGIKSLLFYFFSTLIAVIIGLLVVNAIKPGLVDPEAAQAMLAQAKAPIDIQHHVSTENSTHEIISVFTGMIPPNVVKSASNNAELIGVIFFALLFGYFATKLPLKYRRFQVKLWNSFQEVSLKMADLILKFAPIGVFALVTPKFIGFGFHLFLPLLKFTLTTLLGLSIHLFGVMSLALLAAKINPLDHFKAMAPALLTAFSTSSSIASLPLAMECVEKTAGVSNRVTSFTLPLGVTINLNGSALYECVVVIFVAQFYQAAVDPSFQFGLSTQLVVVFLALLTSFGVAAIPSASIVAIGMILDVVGLPFEYVGIVFVVDRILDMCRTVVNIFSDTVGAVIIGKSEGETNIYSKQLPSEPPSTEQNS